MTYRFIGIRHVSGKPVAAFRPEWLEKDFVLDETSLRARIATLERGGDDTTQERIALKALLEESQ